jgi:hypothetical protein
MLVTDVLIHYCFYESSSGSGKLVYCQIYIHSIIRAAPRGSHG